MSDTDILAAMGISGFGKKPKQRQLDPRRFDKNKREDVCIISVVFVCNIQSHSRSRLLHLLQRSRRSLVLLHPRLFLRPSFIKRSPSLTQTTSVPLRHHTLQTLTHMRKESLSSTPLTKRTQACQTSR